MTLVKTLLLTFVMTLVICHLNDLVDLVNDLGVDLYIDLVDGPFNDLNAVFVSDLREDGCVPWHGTFMSDQGH